MVPSIAVLAYRRMPQLVLCFRSPDLPHILGVEWNIMGADRSVITVSVTRYMLRLRDVITSIIRTSASSTVQIFNCDYRPELPPSFGSLNPWERSRELVASRLCDGLLARIQNSSVRHIYMECCDDGLGAVRAERYSEIRQHENTRPRWLIVGAKGSTGGRVHS